jgi:catechol 2,3-dioxygenase-like lactoylglutathione lyase family enzyme
MKSHFYHAQINIDFKNIEFYKNLMSVLGWDIIFETNGLIGFKSKTSGDLWFADTKNKVPADYDAIGVNHLSIRVDEQKDVDTIVNFLKEQTIDSLFHTPRHRPEFSSLENETYYQVIFETPDKIQLEIVYIGEKK